jgi:hypothetical protein
MGSDSIDFKSMESDPIDFADYGVGRVPHFAPSPASSAAYVSMPFQRF